MTFNIAQKIYLILKDRKQTLAIAESCTGGALSEAITQVPGVSDIFLGGIVAYSPVIKQNLLNIPKLIIDRFSPESSFVAQYMADNTKSLFGSSWSIATTGLSGPTGGRKDVPIGSVWIAITGHSKTSVFDFCFKDLSRLEHRQKTIDMALKAFLELLDKNDQ